MRRGIWRVGRSKQKKQGRQTATTGMASEPDAFQSLAAVPAAGTYHPPQTQHLSA